MINNSFIQKNNNNNLHITVYRVYSWPQSICPFRAKPLNASTRDASLIDHRPGRSLSLSLSLSCPGSSILVSAEVYIWRALTTKSTLYYSGCLCQSSDQFCIRNGQRNPCRIFAHDRDASLWSAETNNVQLAEHEEPEVDSGVLPEIFALYAVYCCQTRRTRVFARGTSLGTTRGECNARDIQDPENKEGAEILAGFDPFAE